MRPCSALRGCSTVPSEPTGASARPVPAETVRRELLALIEWADENTITHDVGHAWAHQVTLWARAHLERLDKWEGLFNAAE
jgi:hypothetical protein